MNLRQRGHFADRGARLMRGSGGQTPTRPTPPGATVKAVGWLIAVWCVGFAAVNLAYEATGRFDQGRYAQYATGIAVMSWLVLMIKLVGAAAAVMAIRRLPRFLPPRFVAVMLWGATALLALYSAGNVVQLAGMTAGIMGSRDDITLLGIGYVSFFLLGALGYAVLAGSFSRRYPVTRRTKAAGVVGAPLLLAVLLVGIPLLLARFGLLPA